MKTHRAFTQITSLLLAGALLSSSTGCVLSSTETVNTDKVYLLGPKTESEPGTATRDVTMKAADTRGTIAFHVDRARECTVTSTPRWQKVHVEGKEGKNVTGGIVTGAILLAVAGGLIATSIALGDWTEDDGAGGAKFTGGGTVGLTGIIVGITGLVVLPRALYHAAVSGTTTTPGEVQFGKPPAGAVRAPEGYDPKVAEGALVPRSERPRYGILDLGAQPADRMAVLPAWATPAKAAPQVESLRSASAFDAAISAQAGGDPALLAIPQASGGSGGDQMRACVAKYTPSCQSKCGENRSCILECLRKPCIEKLDEEIASGDLKQDEYTTVITKTEVCERSADAGVNIAVIVKDLDGVPKTIDIGRTNGSGDVKANVLAGLEGAYPGWPDVKQVILKDAEVVPVEDPSVVLGKLDLEKYPSLKYAEHVQMTKRAREAMAAADVARREREAKERQAQLEAAAKAQYEAEHAEEIKAQAAKKQQACFQQHSSRCSADCQGNQACVKKCMQKMSCK